MKSSATPATAQAPGPLGPAALRTFFRLGEKWGLTGAQERILLGNPGRSTYFRWRKGQVKDLSQDTLERISYLIGIYRALHTLFPSSAQADGWVKRSNDAPLFAGRSALDRMLDGQVSDLFLVRRYLDAQSHWG